MMPEDSETSEDELTIEFPENVTRKFRGLEGDRIWKLKQLLEHLESEIEYERSKGEVEVLDVRVSEMRGYHSPGILCFYTLDKELKALNIDVEGDEGNKEMRTQFYKLQDNVEHSPEIRLEVKGDE